MPFIVVRIATIRSSRQTRGSRCRSGCSCMLIAAMRGRHIPAPRSCLFPFLPQPPWHRMLGCHDMVRNPICQRIPWLKLWRHGDFTLQHPMFRWRMDDGRGRSPGTALQRRTQPQHNRRKESLLLVLPHTSVDSHGGRPHDVAPRHNTCGNSLRHIKSKSPSVPQNTKPMPHSINPLSKQPFIVRGNCCSR